MVENWTENSELYSVNTDGFYMTNPRYQYRYKKDVLFKTKHIGKRFISNTPATYFERHYRENYDPRNYTDIKGDGCIYHASAGCSKTLLLCKMAAEAKDPSYYHLQIRPLR